MAGKYALYLPYKVLDSLSSGNVTDAQFREFIMGVAEYDKTGLFPASRTAGFTMMYELLKSDLDYAKAKYEDIVEKRRQAGKLGGAPIGNQNAAGNRGGGAPVGNQNAAKGDSNQAPEEPDFPDEPTGLGASPEKQTQAKQAKQAKQADTDNRYQSSDKRHKSKDNSNTYTDHVVGVCEKVFLHFWEKLGNPFSVPYKIWDQKWWNEFWDNCPYTQKEIYMALRNIHHCVNNGHYESQYISSDPCKFIQGGMINRGLSSEFEAWWKIEHPQYNDPILKKLKGDNKQCFKENENLSVTTSLEEIDF